MSSYERDSPYQGGKLPGEPRRHFRFRRVLDVARVSVTNHGAPSASNQIGYLRDMHYPFAAGDGIGAEGGAGLQGHRYGVGTRAFNSSNQLRTTWICTRARRSSFGWSGFTMTKRPSGATS